MIIQSCSKNERKRMEMNHTPNTTKDLHTGHNLALIGRTYTMCSITNWIQYTAFWQELQQTKRRKLNMDETEMKELAEDHYRYVESVCHKIYVDAFIHGIKHGHDMTKDKTDTTKKKIIGVGCCQDCPFIEIEGKHKNRMSYFCDHDESSGEFINELDLKSFPIWCPL